MVGRVAARIAPVIDYTDRIKPSSVSTTNALLAGGSRWWHAPGGDGSTPSSVALNTINFSFMGSASGGDADGFATLNGTQQSYIRAALAYISTVANISFNEVGAGSGEIQIGSNFQAGSAGYARYPNDPGGGTVFLANNQSSFTADGGAWDPGSYEFMTIVHEVSHALGLKHPGKYNAGGGVTPGPYLSKALDNRKNTIMSYYDAPNAKVISYSGGTFTSSTVNPLGYGAFDIAALQYLYGAANPASGQTYSWNTDQKFIQTLWDPTGQSTIDLGNQTKNNVVDLRAGRTSSIAIRDAYAEMPFSAAEYARMTTVVNGKTVKLSSVLGKPTYTGANNLTIAAGSQINGVTGGSGSDTIITNEYADTVATGDGSDAVYLTGLAAGINGTSIDGGDGNDTLYVRKMRGFVWTFDGSTTLTLSTAATRTTAAVDVAQVSVQGIESIKYWNGSSYAALRGAALYTDPSAMPAAGGKLSRVA